MVSTKYLQKFFLLVFTSTLTLFNACSSEEEGPAITAAEGLFINEIYAAGVDWFELYNNTDLTKNIGGFFVYDDASAKYQLPAGTSIPAKGYLIIFCDDTNTGLNTNFKLASTGETVYLENSENELADFVAFPKLDNGQSYGRYPDGSDVFAISGVTSQGTSNNTSNAPAITAVSRVPLVPALNQVVTVQAELSNTSQLNSVKLFYRFNGGTYTSILMILNGAFYNAVIPAQASTGKVDYYIEAKSITGTTSFKPFDAPSDAYTYLLNTDAIPELHINEFMAASTTCCPDTDGGTEEFDDWIEIYNAGSSAVDLGGMYLSDDKTNPFNSKIPENDPTATTIQPGGFLIFWADEQRAQGSRHLSFQLSAAGEDVALFYIDGRNISEKTYTAQPSNKSYGRTVDGGTNWQQVDTPTPGASNN